MAVDLLELIRIKVSSMVMEGETTHLFEKENALNQFYPVLLSLLKNKPDLLSTLTNQLNPRLGDLFNGLTGVKQQLLEQVGGSAPHTEIEHTLNSAITPVLGLVQSEAGSSDPDAVVHYLSQFDDSISRALPHWATALLSALGIGATATHISPIPETVTTQAREPYQRLAEEPVVEKNKWWPIAAIIAALIILGLLFKSCSNKEEPVPVGDTSAGSEQAVRNDPATLQWSTGATGDLLTCGIMVSDVNLMNTLQKEIKQIFNAGTACGVDTSANYHNQFTDQDAIPSVMKALKGIPNLSLAWVGDQVSVQASNPADAEKAVTLIKGIAKNVTVMAQAPIDVNTAVDTSITDAEKALASIKTDKVRALDVAAALNLQIINFATASSDIPAANKSVLDQAAALLQRADQVQLTVAGHTDATGDAAMNKKLSQERAQSVVNYLVSKGVDPAQLQAVGYGQEKPKADNATEEGKFRNRRIEFEVLNTTTGTVRSVDESGVSEIN